jgi:hypothetical protein
MAARSARLRCAVFLSGTAQKRSACGYQSCFLTVERLCSVKKSRSASHGPSGHS